jgi:hypothetical protein
MIWPDSPALERITHRARASIQAQKIEFAWDSKTNPASSVGHLLRASRLADVHRKKA